MPLRLLVIDGADQGRFFRLPEAGTVLLGNSQRHADICLHDLYVGRVHCELAVAEGAVTITARDTPAGTLVNEKRITQQAILPGEVLHVGNSHLRLEFAADDAAWGQPEEPEEAPEPPPAAGERPAGLQGRTLGHYQVAGILGRGHCGVVYRAHDLKKDQDVALKVLDAAFPSGAPEMLGFAKALRTRLPLHHPNLVGLHGAGKSGPHCWLDLELVEGESLAQAIERNRDARKIKWRRALNLARDVGRALAYCHQHRLVHGNVTPHNVLIRKHDESARLNDLLLQKALEGSALQQATMEAKMLAELPYLAPEQADPQLMLVDELSDQYSLGVLVYALLTGRPPFAGSAPEETLRQIREDPPVKPQKLNKQIPDDFQAAVLKMLAKRPEERYSRMEEMLGDLERIGGSNL